MDCCLALCAARYTLATLGVGTAAEVLDASQRVEEPGPLNVEIVDYHQG